MSSGCRLSCLEGVKVNAGRQTISLLSERGAKGAAPPTASSPYDKALARPVVDSRLSHSSVEAWLKLD